MEPLRIGIIGCGVFGTVHITEASRSEIADLVAVADVDESRAKAAAEEFNVPTYYTNADDMLNDERIEAVILALPTAIRTPIAYKALEKGKHVIVEKPAGRNCAEIEKLIAMRGDRVVACCSPRFAFTGHAEAAKKCVESGVLGKIRVVRIRAILSPPANPIFRAIPANTTVSNPPPWRESMELNGGGILVNWSHYDLNYVMYITNWQLKPRMLLAKWWHIGDKMSAYVAPGSDADSHYAALVTCDDDILLTMERGEFTSATTDQAWEIIGTEGTLHLAMRPQRGRPTAVVLDKFVPGKGIVSETIWDAGGVGDGSGLNTDKIIDDFIHAVRENREPRTTLENALVMQKITDAIYKSAKIEQAVAIS